MGATIRAKEVSLKKIQKDAEDSFRNGYYCCEALMDTIRRDFDIDVPEQVIAMASGMAVGAGKSGCMCGALSSVIWIAIVLKLIVCSQGVKKALTSDPIAASVFATFPMGTMLLAGYAKPFIGGAAQIIWFAAVILHAALIVWFSLKYMVVLKLERVFASYFIVYVGIAASSITAPAFGQQAIGQAAFWLAPALAQVCRHCRDGHRRGHEPLCLHQVCAGPAGADEAGLALTPHFTQYHHTKRKLSAIPAESFRCLQVMCIRAAGS